MTSRTGFATRADRATPARLLGGQQVSIVRQLAGLMLLVGASIHVFVGFEHVGSSFGTASFLAGAAQLALAVGVLLRPSTLLLQAIVIIEIALVQLYVLNVTVGLPPAIAHSHQGGDHTILGLTLAWPGLVEMDGVIAVASQIVATVSALILGASLKLTSGRR